MRLSVSNIAWDLRDEPAVAALLGARGIDRVDIAPGKYFPDPEAATTAEIREVRQLWADRGFAIVGMQALLFGTVGLNLFADADGRLARRLAALCSIGGELGARALTFGSPRQRDRTGLSDDQALAIAGDVFGPLGDIAAAHGVSLCLEPNPALYGCNFMTTTDEAAAVVTAIGHPAIRLQLDTGTLAANTEPPQETVIRHAALIGHVHASEPGLAVLGSGDTAHAAIGAALRVARPDLVVTIEMGPQAEGSPIDAIARAVDIAIPCYGDGQ